VAVNEVQTDSAAANAGIKAGDIIVQLGYSRIDTVKQYMQVITELPINSPILVRFYRQGWAVSKTIVIE
jgi:serine protease Do